MPIPESKLEKAGQTQIVPLVLAELKKRGHEASFLIKADKYNHKSYRMVVDGVRVPFHVEEQWTSSRAYARRTGKLKVVVDWLWMSSEHLPGSSVKFKKRSFAQSKARPETLGFDIEKIVEHVEQWAAEWKRLDGLRSQSQNNLEQWVGLVSLLQQQHPKEAERLKLRATTKGIEIRAIVGHKEAEALLKALAS